MTDVTCDWRYRNLLFSLRRTIQFNCVDRVCSNKAVRSKSNDTHQLKTNECRQLGQSWQEGEKARAREQDITEKHNRDVVFQPVAREQEAIREHSSQSHIWMKRMSMVRASRLRRYGPRPRASVAPTKLAPTSPPQPSVNHEHEKFQPSRQQSIETVNPERMSSIFRNRACALPRIPQSHLGAFGIFSPCDCCMQFDRPTKSHLQSGSTRKDGVHGDLLYERQCAGW